MRVDNLKFHPIRLRLRRLGKDTFEIGRGDKDLGVVKRENGKWYSRSTQERWVASAVAISFRTAVLKLARLWTFVSSDGPQNIGDVRMIRIDARGCWYTVIFDKHGRYIYEDHTLNKPLSVLKQAELKLVIREADKWAKENL